MHDICVRIYEGLCHRSICSGPPIELTLVDHGLTPGVISSKTDSTVNKTPIHVKTVYQTQQTLHRCQYGDEDKATSLNIKSIHINITGLHEVTLLNIKSIRGSIKGLQPYPKIDQSNGGRPRI